MSFKGTNIKPFDKKVWFSYPTIHGSELDYMPEIFLANWTYRVQKYNQNRAVSR